MTLDPRDYRPSRFRTAPIFNGCTTCDWVEVRGDVLPFCPGGHPAHQVIALVTCDQCRWADWYRNLPACPTSPSHSLQILEYGPDRI